MNCPKCNLDLIIENVKDDGTIIYACMNPRCSEYRKSFDIKSDGTIGESQPTTLKIKNG